MIALNNFALLPPQMIPLKEKDDQWKKECMDVLEAIGRSQFFDNMSLLENYELVKGRFIYHHYFEREGYHDLVASLTQEFKIPSHLRHYDIISPVINTLSGEQQKRPDTFRVRAYDDESTNQILRQKEEMLHQSIFASIREEIGQKLYAQGLDINKNQFESEEEKQEHEQQVNQAMQQMTPPQIQKYMKYSWRATAEMWGDHQLNADKERFNLPEKEKKEFEDMLIADRCFRHFYVTAVGYEQETWNPITTFFHKSPDIDYVEDGDYVGRVFYMSIPAIIDRYGYRMTAEELKSLQDETLNLRPKAGVIDEFFDATSVPFPTYRDYKTITDSFGFDPINGYAGAFGERAMLDAMTGNVGSNTWVNTSSLMQVTEAYWKTQRRIGKATLPDPETGELITIIVDETFNTKGFKELKDATWDDEEEPYTIVWTYVNQIYKGKKLNKGNTGLKEDLYFDIGPADFQFKGEYNVYGCKLPVCGQLFNNRNAQSMSLVDLMKPHQIGYNVAMNQLYEIMQREIGRFALMDINVIPSLKDWGGEKSYEKFMMVAKSLGIGLVDTSPANTKGASFNQFTQIDLDESARMLNRAKLAEFFEMQALKQVGITPQRQGQVLASTTATGIEAAVNQSYAQTESYFTNFNDFKRRCLRMNLEIAQYVQSKERDVVISYTQSDLGREFMRLSGSDLLLKDLQVYVSNSQETMRILETLRNLAINNNTSNASILDLATIISSNSITEIKQTLKDTLERQEAQQQQQIEVQQQINAQNLEAQAAEAEAQREFEATENEKDRANERYVAEVKAIGTGTVATGPDADNSGIPDVLEIEKFNHERSLDSEERLFREKEMEHQKSMDREKIGLEKDKLKLQYKKIAADKEKTEKTLAIQKMKAKQSKAKKKPSK